MHWKELAHATDDQRDFYWWEREQEAVEMIRTYQSLARHNPERYREAIASWENARQKARVNRGAKP